MIIKLNDDSYLDHSLISAIRRGAAMGNRDEYYAYCFDGGGVLIGTDSEEAARIAREVNDAGSKLALSVE